MDIMARLSDCYIACKEKVNMEKTDQEVEKIEAEYSEAQNHAQVAYDRISSNRVVKKIWEESEKSQASNAGKSMDKAVTPQSDSRPENTVLKVPQQVVKSPVRGSMYPISEVGFDYGVEPVLLGQDMWKQLKCVTISTFSGDKRTYQNWKAEHVWTRHLLRQSTSFYSSVSV